MSIDSEVTMDNSKEMDEYEAVDEELVAEYLTCRFFTCSSCGGDIILNGGQNPTKCVYCGKSTLVFDKEAQTERPQYLLPFGITEKEAVQAIKKKFKHGFFISHKLKHITSSDIQKMYIPYWLVDGNHLEADTFNCQKREREFSGSNLFNGVRFFEHRSILNRREEFSTFVADHRYGRAGKVRFRNLTVDGSILLSDYSSARVEPFDLSKIKEFDEKDLEGIYTCASDVHYKDLYDSVHFRASSAFQKRSMDTISSSEPTIVKSNSVTFVDQNVHSAMLPMYFASFMEKGLRKTILVNGQTGKVVYGARFKYKTFLATLLLLTAVLAYPATLGFRYLRRNVFGESEDVYSDVLDLFDRYSWHSDFPIVPTIGFLALLIALIILFSASIRYYKKTVKKFKIEESSTMGVFSRKKGW